VHLSSFVFLADQYSLCCYWSHRNGYWERNEAVSRFCYVTDQVGLARTRVRVQYDHNDQCFLIINRRKNAPSEEPIFQCIGMLASAVGPNLTKLLHDQLDLMLACGLSEPLVQALAAIAKYITPLLKTIQGMHLYLTSGETR
jgi:hypothetical protein